jgi:two-component system, NarL family, invasion response regulator UvrY
MAILDRKWDLIILDIDLPDRSGLDLLGDIRAMAPKVPVLVLSGHSEEEFGRRVLKTGAAGFLRKLAPVSETAAAIGRVISGKKFISADLAGYLARDLVRPGAESKHEALSEREFEVLRQ